MPRLSASLALLLLAACATLVAAGTWTDLCRQPGYKCPVRNKI